jgi:hypothetical protein
MKGDVQKMVTISNQKLWFTTTMVMLIFLQCSDGVAVGSQRVPAMFVFGDSLVDVGNNNFLSSLAKSNYFPYGCDFKTGTPSGRFSNGETFSDMLGNFTQPFIHIYMSLAYQLLSTSETFCIVFNLFIGFFSPFFCVFKIPPLVDEI